MIAYLLIGIGGALGSVGRYWASGVVANLTGGAFPYGTMFVNVTGAIVIGFFAALTGTDGRIFVGTSGRQFVMTGICGGYTTFSTFSLETMALARDGEWLYAGLNAILSVALCLAAVWIGAVAAEALNRGV
ncbi:MAG TPA: fluoride efflux transporter CrcB [Candidatus Binataceae bacterium]|nr:fluoride efflux transporter CrcB [Candidatus Binataceae bacterium]